MKATDRTSKGLGWRVLGRLPLLVAAGYIGYATQATDITSTGATLRAKTSCTADTTNNPCTG